MSIVFKAPPRFDADAIRAIRPEFERLAASKRDVVIDLARTETLDGSGIGALVFAFKRLAASGNRLTVNNISGQPLQLLHSADLLRTLSHERSAGVVRSTFRWMARKRPVSHPTAIADATTAPHSDMQDQRTKGAA